MLEADGLNEWSANFETWRNDCRLNIIGGNPCSPRTLRILMTMAGRQEPLRVR